VIALDLPADVRDEIGAWGQKGLSDPALRRIAPENLNITLLFLGHRPEGQVERIMAGIKTFFEGLGAPWLELRNPESRPTRGRPRLFALPAISPETEVMQVGLRALLTDRALYRAEPDGRAFWPHVTVARVRPLAGSSRRPMPVQEPPSGPLPRTVTDPCWGEGVSLYRSDLRPTGAVYTRLGRVDLAPR
jgi:RNA 2',3'-cyclic 3'-phosphodiesterase